MQETRELVRAAATTAMQVAKSLDDGKFDFRDMVGFVGMWSVWRQAIEGIHSVPTEWQGVTQDDMEDVRRIALEVAEEFGIEVDASDTRWLADGAKHMSQGIVEMLRAVGKL